MAKLLPVDTAPRDFSPSPITDAEAAAMFRAAINLFRLWRLTDEPAATLLDLPLSSYRRWTSGGPGLLGRDGQARLSNPMGIQHALHTLFREPQPVNAWVAAPNQASAGRSARSGE